MHNVFREELLYCVEVTHASESGGRDDSQTVCRHEGIVCTQQWCPNAAIGDVHKPLQFVAPFIRPGLRFKV